MKITPAKIFFGVSALALAAWLYWYCFPLAADNATAGQIGDKFGALNTLFTGFGFAGIAAGLWLQHRDHLADGESVIRAVSAEIEFSWENFRGVSLQIAQVPEGEIMPHRFNEDTATIFPIYNANAASLGKVRDVALLRALVRAYSNQTALVNMIRMNGRLLNTLEELDREVRLEQSSDARNRRDVVSGQLRRMAGFIRTQNVLTERAIMDLLGLLPSISN